MFPYSTVPERMEYIQKLFLQSGELVHASGEWQALISPLDKEPVEYRSVAYEGTSFELGMKDLSGNEELHIWQQFRQACREHAFHLDIGLGWAIAKTGVFPKGYMDSMNQFACSMVLDGIGYYYALFKGRSTLKDKQLPLLLEQDDIVGFDQGVGRRLWYMAKGNVHEAMNLLRSFESARQGDLFRGIGIACGYVGGTGEEELALLRESAAEHLHELQSGIVLAAMSRVLSHSVTHSLELAWQIICGQSLDYLGATGMDITNNFLYLYHSCEINTDWLALLKSDLLQTNS